LLSATFVRRDSPVVDWLRREPERRRRRGPEASPWMRGCAVDWVVDVDVGRRAAMQYSKERRVVVLPGAAGWWPRRVVVDCWRKVFALTGPRQNWAGRPEQSTA
jgi:hypothetical protein